MRRLTRLAASLALTLASIGLSACTSTQDVLAKRLIISAADAQRAGADAFSQAKLEEAVAIGRCKSKADEQNIGLVRSTLDATCETLGAPLPYPSETLNAFAKPLNALYDAIYAANAARKAAGSITGNTNDQLGEALTELALRLFDFFRDVKLLPVEKKPIDKAKAAVAKMLPEG